MVLVLGAYQRRYQTKAQSLDSFSFVLCPLTVPSFIMSNPEKKRIKIDTIYLTEGVTLSLNEDLTSFNSWAAQSLQIISLFALQKIYFPDIWQLLPVKSQLMGDRKRFKTPDATSAVKHDVAVVFPRNPHFKVPLKLLWGQFQGLLHDTHWYSFTHAQKKH